MKSKGNRPDVMIAMCTGDTIMAETAMCLTNMIASTIRGLPNLRVGIHNKRMSLIQVSRHEVVKELLEINPKFVLWIDHDMTFPPLTLVRLLTLDKDIAGIVASRRSWPPSPIGRTLENKEITKEQVLEGGVVEMMGVGTGIMLVNMKVFKTMLHKRPDHPFFDVTWSQETRAFRSEDYNFCNLARGFGYKIYADLDLSKEIGHIGHFTYKATEDEADIRAKD